MGKINNSGVVISSTLAYYSELISVKKGEIYKATAYAAKAQSVLTEYDSNQSVIRCNEITQQYTISGEISIDIDNLTKYIRYNTFLKETNGYRNYLSIVNSVYKTGIVSDIEFTESQGTINENGALSSSSDCISTNFIEVQGGNVIYVDGEFSKDNYIACYTSSNESSFNGILHTVYDDSSRAFYFRIPSDSKYVRISAKKINKLLNVSVNDDLSKQEGVIVRLLKQHDTEIYGNNGETSGSLTDFISSKDQKLGFVMRPFLNGFDYIYFPMYGQSYSVNGNKKITDYDFDENVFMHGDKPTGPEGNSIKHLSTTYDYVISTFGDTFSRLLKMYRVPRNILVQSYGIGSKTIQQLSKGEGGEGLYESNFLAGIQNAKKAVEEEGKTFVCPAILYLQGESDMKQTAKNDYKRLFRQLANDMQNDVCEVTGQTVKPLIITYIPGCYSFKDKGNDVPQAIIELAFENEDIYYCGSYYYMPNNGHCNSDGWRWLGELFAKYTYQLLLEGTDQSIKIYKCEKVGENGIRIYFDVPNPPLVIDTYTVTPLVFETPPNYGFRAYDSFVSREIEIVNVSVNSNCVTIIFSEDIDINNLYITYANNISMGIGNIRDSCKWMSYNVLKISDDENLHNVVRDKNGNKIVGKHYPMYNWLPHFGILVKDYFVE